MNTSLFHQLMSAIGLFVHTFGLTEVYVAAWLLRLETSNGDAIEFLAKTRQLSARIARLKVLLRDRGDAEVLGALLDRMEPLRALRNDIVHGALGSMDDEPQLITWKRTIPISPKQLGNAVDELAKISMGLNEAYLARFGEILQVGLIAQSAPPAEE